MKYKKELILLAVVIFEILLLVNLTVANSYIIHQNHKLLGGIKIIEGENNFEDTINLGLNLLIGILSIKQIGTVSAQESYCCPETNDGKICHDITDIDDCSVGVLPTNCEDADSCKTVTCIDEANGICSVSTKQRCISEGGKLDENPIDEVEECQSGCCILEDGAYKQFIRQIQCTNLGGVFDVSIPQEDCRIYTEEMGACVFDDASCQFMTETTCDALRGDFNLRILCSNEDLITDCDRPMKKIDVETTCYDDKVYFLDTCGNIANVYDYLKWDDEEYWKSVQNSSCKVDLKDDDSIESCGNCNSWSSVCDSSSKIGINPKQGNYACKDLTCKDENGKTRQNQEAWCLYESYIGNSRDVVGSEHRMRWCDRGEIKTQPCGIYRGEICAERDMGEISIARCRFNEGWKCLQVEPVAYEFDDDNEISNSDDVDDFINECKDLSDCRIQSVDLYEKDAKMIYWGTLEEDYSNLFTFDICVPKYPPGLDSWEGDSNAKDLCSIASIDCPTSWITGVFHTQCRGNCNCLNKTFADKMNELCVSLGDCGGYVNTEGQYTKNFNTFDINTLNDTEGSYWIYEFMGVENEAEGIRFGQEGLLFDANGDISGRYGESYAREDNIGKGNDLPEYFTSAEKGAYGGDPLKDIEWSIEDAQDTTGADFMNFLTMLTVAAAAIFLPINPVVSAILGAIAAILKWISDLFGGVGQEEIVDVGFTCKPWQPISGGEDCSKCNEDPLRACTEYKCRSLGSACRILKDVYKSENYESENQVCIHQNPNDVTPPQISIKDLNRTLYSVSNRPGGNGIKIENKTSEDGCIQEFSEINFSLMTKEGAKEDYAKCVYNWKSVQPNPPDYILEGEEFKEGNSNSIIHAFEKRLLFVTDSRVSNVDGILGERTGELNMYVRCEDATGNFNYNEYVVNFCIKEGEDIEYARVKEYYPEDNSFLRYEVDETFLTIDLNEPAKCKFSYGTDKLYDAMENEMACEPYIQEEIKSRWGCSTNLTGLIDSENNIYIKCKDQPWINKTGYEGPWTEEDRNVNLQGFLYTLYATENDLEISLISLQGEIKKGDVETTLDDLEITTSEGMNNGISTCKYKFIKSPLNLDVWDFFSETNSKNHKQPFNLPGGNYNILITCKDKARNNASGNAVFNLIVDELPPEVTRINPDGITTDEEAACYYNLNRCSFDLENATSMTTGVSTEHFIEWNIGKTYYVKCKDIFGNLNPDCAIRVTSSL